MHSICEVHGVRVLTAEPEVPTLGGEDDAAELIGQAYGEDASVVVVPVARVDERFFTLSTRVAGEVARKFQSYQVVLAVLGDLGAHLASDSFRAFVHETNKGTHVWFLDDRAALDERLRTAGRTLRRSG